jgi:hypothetical protein
MTIEPRLVVTGRDADGTSVFVTDRPADPTTIAAFPGTFYLMWGTDDGGATVGTRPREPKTAPFFPGPGGTRALFLRFAPHSSEPTGALVVQQGTRHAWHNKSDKPALMCYVLIGATREG